VILSVLEEVLEYRRRAPGVLLRKELVATKALLLVISLVTPLFAPVRVSLALAALMLALLALLGLRLSALYVALSALLLYASMALSAIIFNGDMGSAARFCLAAASTLSAFIIIASTTPPSLLRRWPALYILAVIFSGVLREILDISVVLRARGSSGLRYWLRVIVASVAAALTRADALRDSLSARGVELGE